jgi:hypothetical protein
MNTTSSARASLRHIPQNNNARPTVAEHRVSYEAQIVGRGLVSNRETSLIHFQYTPAVNHLNPVERAERRQQPSRSSPKCDPDWSGSIIVISHASGQRFSASTNAMMRRQAVEVVAFRIDVHHHVRQGRQRVEEIVAHYFSDLVALHGG